MSEQGVLHAGAVFGELKTTVNDKELLALREQKMGTHEYLSLAEKLAQQLMYPTFARFLDICRTNFGQYWIKQLEAWDSRKTSLGLYCQSLHLQWSSDDGKSWTAFLPNEPVLVVKSEGYKSSNQLQYISHESWDRLVKATVGGYKPTVAATTLSLAHEFMDKGDLRQAFIEGVSALEVAIESYFEANLDPELRKSMAQFLEINLPARVVSAATLVGGNSKVDLGMLLEAIKVRNRIVHDGWDPSRDAGAIEKLHELLKGAALFISGPGFLFPSSHFMVIRQPDSEWKKLA